MDQIRTNSIIESVVGDSLTLVSIELENFKSFLGHHGLGPFLDLTAVVGPNGGGNHLLFNF